MKIEDVEIGKIYKLDKQFLKDELLKYGYPENIFGSRYWRDSIKVLRKGRSSEGWSVYGDNGYHYSISCLKVSLSKKLKRVINE